MKLPLECVPELFPVYVSTILGSSQDGEPTTALTRPFHIPFVLPAYSFFKDPKIHLLPIHPPLTPHFIPLPHLSGLYPYIQCLPIDKRGGEDPTSVLKRLECCRCGLCGDGVQMSDKLTLQVIHLWGKSVNNSLFPPIKS